MPAPSRARGSRQPAPAGGPRSWLLHEIDTLYPGSFALVMATGIISNAFFFDGDHAVADALLILNLAAFCWLVAATLVRIIRKSPAVWADLIDPRTVFAFFTIVAAADVLGAALKLHGYGGLALALWLGALALWFVLIYFSFGVLIFLNTAHRANIVHGGWLIAIVGTESLVILGTAVAPSLGGLGTASFVLIHMLWGIGLALYGIFVTLFASRIFFLDFEPEDITPLLWVVMGAAAISTNAGSTLILSDSGLPFLRSMRPFIDGVTLIAWAWATWWIPLLILLGIWKHGVCRIPIAYSPTLWSLVFPLGMYALATLRLSLAGDFPPLAALSRAMVWIALAVWAATALALARATWQSWRQYRAATS
ncbi:MAG TPA: tellurite resistance/C4-dicarboxylate transporter family protein [Pseudolabrys sp.]|nr:tellurite resistance/C4-dicarboxylate transporter family protein [Pseudolabrys sp.]